MFLQTHFDGTYHILAFYLISLILSFVILVLVKPIDDVVNRLNKIEVGYRKRLSYIGLGVSIALLLITQLLMSFREWRAMSFEHFMIFAAFAFIFLPEICGLIGVYGYVIKNKGFKLGNVLLLLTSLSCFGWASSNIHDVIWCGYVTDFYTHSKSAGRDLEFWYNVFGIFDQSLFDYQVFGSYTVFTVLVELCIAICAYYKFYRINKKELQKNKFELLIIYLILFFNSVFLGFVIYVLDYPWDYSVAQFFYFGFVQLSIGALIYFLMGRSLVLNKKEKKELDD
jgi:hypothetical protein